MSILGVFLLIALTACVIIALIFIVPLAACLSSAIISSAVSPAAAIIVHALFAFILLTSTVRHADTLLSIVRRNKSLGTTP